MTGKAPQADRCWRPSILAAIVALALFMPIIISGNPLLEIFCLFLTAPIIGFAILIAAIVKKGPRRAVLLLALVVIGAVS
jgi:hypothetical protein